MSFDSPAKNKSWAEQEGFGFDLWSDLGRELAMYYGSATSSDQYAASRVTMVLDADGTLILEYVDNIDTGTHPSQVLSDCEALFGP